MKFGKTVVFLLVMVVTALPAWGVEVTPINVTIPTIAGETFSFDLAISDADPIGLNASASKITISVIPTGLTFDVAGSETLASDASYWIFGNSVGVFAEDSGSDTYAFSDNADNPNAEDLMSGEILARYAFTWDGVAKDYTFTINLNTTNSFVLLSSFSKEAIEFNQGSYSGDDTGFTVSIPEPATLMLLAFGSVMLARKRRI